MSGRWRRPLIAIMAVLLLDQRAASADHNISIGYHGSAERLNIATGESLGALSARELLQLRLVAVVPENTLTGYELGAAEGLTREEGEVWKVDIDRAAHFNSGEPIEAEDVAFSIEVCRAFPGTLLSISDRSVRILIPDRQGAAAKIAAAAALAQCPLFERTTAEIFKEDFGWGTHFVSGGPWSIARNRNDGRMRFRAGGTQAELLPFSVEEGIQRLRIGSLQGFIVGRSDHFQPDNSLLMRECGAYRVIYRELRPLPCLNRLRPVE